MVFVLFNIIFLLKKKDYIMPKKGINNKSSVLFLILFVVKVSLAGIICNYELRM